MSNGADVLVNLVARRPTYVVLPRHSAALRYGRLLVAFFVFAISPMLAFSVGNFCFAEEQERQAAESPDDLAGLTEAMGEGGDGLVVEALIDGDSVFHVTPEGVYWTCDGGRSAKPGLHGGHDEPTYLNGIPWFPRWGIPDNRRCRDRTEIARFEVSAVEKLTFELLAVSDVQGAAGIDRRQPVTTLRSENAFVVSIPDRDSGWKWYRFRIYAAQGAEADSGYEVDLAAFIEEIDKTYPFFDLKGIREDWAATRADLSARVAGCESDSEFLGLVIEAIRCLRDSHMWLRDARVEAPPLPARFYPGISFMPATDNRVVVMYGSDDHGELTPGTLVAEIDGEDARQYLEARAKEAWATSFCSGPQRARMLEFRMPLRGGQGDTHTIAYLDEGQTREMTLTCSVVARGWPHQYNLPEGLTRYGRSFYFTKLAGGTGYMYLRRVDESIEPGMARAVEAYPDARGWIVDLRGNGGGGYDKALIERVESLPRPVAVLIDAGCMSAGETLARDLRRGAAARLFGSRTAGASSSKRTWQFPSGIASVVFSTRSRWRNDGQPIEFNGIEPDVEVEAVPEEVAQGLNSAICRAEEYLQAVLPEVLKERGFEAAPKAEADEGEKPPGLPALAPIPAVNELPGTLVFQGRYRHRNRGREMAEPGALWLKRAEDGAMAAVVQLPLGGTTYVALGDKANRLTKYSINYAAPAGTRGVEQAIEISSGEVRSRRESTGGESEVQVIAVAEGALFAPNSQPDPYCVANILLRGMALEEGEAKEFDAYDWGSTGEAMAGYRVRLSHAGKERVAVPAGAFEAEHLTLTQLTDAGTWFKKSEGDVTDFWVLESGVIVRILRHREPYEVELLMEGDT